ncbi:MAG: hypothetical protein E3J45_04225 [Candidatus Zixiibacteriota bacterium]|nr:MAG: hypothetical protein E3J45_04225 [candidate division Zixibacteria bacterium]
MSKMIIPTIIILSLCLFAVFIGGEVRKGSAVAGHAAQVLPCVACHSCESPTHEQPCLRPCPRSSPIMMAEPSPDEGPEELTIDILVDRYEAVEFPHQMHAEISGGCSNCHHHTAIGDTPACSDCHNKPFDPENLQLPGLKGAFHRQCLDCHREMGATTECTGCHAKKETKGE